MRGVVLSAGEQVRLGVKIYGRQDVRDDVIGDMPDITFEWVTLDARSQNGTENGDFTGIVGPGNNREPNIAPYGRGVLYTPHRINLGHTASVQNSISALIAYPPRDGETEQEAIERCTASFEITVKRNSPTEPTPQPPVDPDGAIPLLLTDADGNQYEVFTPVGGGTFIGEDVTLSAEPGAVPNGEVIGIRAQVDGEASNVGRTHHRMTLAGSYYRVSVVDASGESLSTYLLDDLIEVCFPLPSRLSSRISDVAMVSARDDGTMTVLSSKVRLVETGVELCGALSQLPARLAAGHLGSPSALPTAVPDAAPEAPETGGASPTAAGILWLILLSAAAFAIAGLIVMSRRRV